MKCFECVEPLPDCARAGGGEGGGGGGDGVESFWGADEVEGLEFLVEREQLEFGECCLERG